MKDNIDIRVYHYRVCLDQHNNRVLASRKQIIEHDLIVLPKGGMTEAVILAEDGETVISSATAYCNDLDHYNKRMGRLVAIGRALFPLEKPEEAVRRARRRLEEQGQETVVH